MIRITIIGLGLIGSSLGMALRNADPKESALGAVEIIGYDRDPAVTRESRGRLAIDRPARSLAEAIDGTDIIVLATPVQTIRAVMQDLVPLLAEGMVVTDVASTKLLVGQWAAELLPSQVDFIGGHPMAGREQSGPKAAKPDLFKDAIYCLTAGPRTRAVAIDAVDALVRTVGAKPYYIEAAEHDAYVAGISHLPLLLSSTLVSVTGASSGWKELAALASTGFRDVSRLASGDPQMQSDILMTNPHGLTRWIDAYIAELSTMRAAIEQGRADEVGAMLQRAKQTRDEWLAARPGLRPGEADFEQPVQIDRPSLLGLRLPRNNDKPRT
jgi:prephenate dehydrogenase